MSEKKWTAPNSELDFRAELPITNVKLARLILIYVGSYFQHLPTLIAETLEVSDTFFELAYSDNPLQARPTVGTKEN